MKKWDWITQVLQEDKLTKLMWAVVVLWIIAQLVVVGIHWETPQFSDAMHYDAYALHCFENHTFYPDTTQVYSRFIFNPGYVNYLLLHLHLFGSLSFVSIANVLLNILILLEIYTLVKRFFHKKSALLAVLFYCLLPSNILLVQPHLTEIPFLALILGAICLVSKHIGWKGLLAAGILFALANWIRPVVVLFLLPVLVYMLVSKYKRTSYIALLLPFVFSVLLIGGVTKNNSGHFIYQASTGGFNLIQGANDDMNGGYGSTCYQEGKIGYIEEESKLTYAERDAVWKSRSIDWVLHNPVKYIAYMPVKFARMWWGDDYLDGFLKGGTPFLNAQPTMIDKLKRVLSGVLFSLPYYVIMCCFLITIVRYWRKFGWREWILLSPLALGTIMQMMIYGTQRYHYPYMPIVIGFAAYGIIQWAMSKATKEQNDEIH